MYQKIIQFIKYHNGFAIGVSLIFVFMAGALAASPEFRENFISSEEIVRSVDNSGIISANLDNFNFRLQIKTITEDAKNYYIVYTYKTITIEDYVWQEAEIEKTLTVSKEALGDKDLGLYVAEELGEVIDYELSYLKEVQQIEKEKGLTQKIVTTQYAGLIGKFLSSKEEVFPGYEPVIKPPEIVSQPEIVEEPIVQEPITSPPETPPVETTSPGEEGTTPPAGEPPAEDGCDATHLGLCLNETDCQTAVGVWDGEKNTCNEKPQCEPNWQCSSDWQPAVPEDLACGQIFKQTRTCADGCDNEKIEEQELKGTYCEQGTCDEKGECQPTE